MKKKNNLFSKIFAQNIFLCILHGGIAFISLSFFGCKKGRELSKKFALKYGRKVKNK